MTPDQPKVRGHSRSRLPLPRAASTSAAAEHATRDEVVEQTPQRIIAATAIVIPRPIIAAVYPVEARMVVPTVVVDFGADHVGRGRNRRDCQGRGGDHAGDDCADEYPARSSGCGCREQRQSFLATVHAFTCPDFPAGNQSRPEIESTDTRAYDPRPISAVHPILLPSQQHSRQGGIGPPDCLRNTRRRSEYCLGPSEPLDQLRYRATHSDPRGMLVRARMPGTPGGRHPIARLSSTGIAGT